MPRNITINMISKKAGVSRGTVDRVLNQRGHVNPDTEQKVLHVMKKMGYVPIRDEQIEALGLDVNNGKTIHIGVLLSNEQGYFREEIMRGLTDAQVILDDSSADLTVEICKTALTEEILEKMDQMVADGASGLIIQARTQNSVVEKIEQYYKRGIPVVALNSDIPGSRRLFYVGQDGFRGGRIAGDLMLKCIRPGEKILICMGNHEYSSHAVRRDGFLKRIRESGIDVEPGNILETYNDYDITYQKVHDALEKDHLIRGIYMANRSLSGCSEAVSYLNLPEKIYIIGHDVTESGKRLLKDGKIDFLISQDLSQQASNAVLSLLHYLQEGELPDDYEKSAMMQVFCGENLD